MTVGEGTGEESAAGIAWALWHFLTALKPSAQGRLGTGRS